MTTRKLALAACLLAPVVALGGCAGLGRSAFPTSGAPVVLPSSVAPQPMGPIATGGAGRSIRGQDGGPPPQQPPYANPNSSPGNYPNSYPSQASYPGQPGTSNGAMPGDGAGLRGPMAASGQRVNAYQPATQPTANWNSNPAGANQGLPFVPGATTAPWPTDGQVTGPGPSGALNMPDNFGAPIGAEPVLEGTPVPVDIYLQEARTGRFMFGVGVNSDAGLTGQIVVDERNFDLFAVPTSFDDFVNGTAFRGGGQGMRIEAMPGNLVQRYLFSFTEPYLFDLPVSLNLSGFLFDRRFDDWTESRIGGRVGLGYRLTHDLSVTAGIRMEGVEISNPVVTGVPELDSAIGRHEIYSGRLTLTHDTRDTPFLPTEGHFLELNAEQVFGSFDYSRAEIDYRRYFLVRERADGSGRHTVSFSTRVGVTGSQTPIFENYFAGGFSTIRGFDFRGASPVVGPVSVGGEFRWLNSLEYFFPLTADDMVRGVVFCDFGTVEEQIDINAEDFRVAPGFGLRLAIPALGPAPLALDLAFPVAREDTDDIQNFSFFVGFGRG